MSEEEFDMEKFQKYMEKKLEAVRKEEARFNSLMDEVFKLNSELVLMKLDLALRLHKKTIEITAELDGREYEARMAMEKISQQVDKIMVENEKLLRNELIKARAKGMKRDVRTDGNTGTVDPGSGYT